MTSGGSLPTFSPFPAWVELTEARHGRMLHLREDAYVGRSFQAYGEFSEGEVALFTHFVPPGAVVVDAGANIGAHTVPLAQMAGPEGLVLAFEPQRILHQILCANLALNSVPNTLANAMALGDREGTCTVPALDYGRPNNFGGIPMVEGGPGETVPMVTLDSYGLERLDFMKVDVEGAEVQVLSGARETLARCRPALYVENDRKEQSAALIRLLQELGYSLWWHLVPLFPGENHKGNPENVFGNATSFNMVGLHRTRKPLTGLRPVQGPEDAYPTQADGAIEPRRWR